MKRIVGHNDKQKGRESKFFECSVLDIFIGPDTHLELDLSPQDLFELIRSFRGDHLQGRDHWEKINRKFSGAHIRHINFNACYTTENFFKKFPSPSTIDLIHKGLEDRTKTKYEDPLYVLVYTKKALIKKLMLTSVLQSLFLISQ